MVKNPPAGDARDASSITRSRGSPGIGNSNPFQFSCLGNSIDRGAWQTADHGVTEELGITEQRSTQTRKL